MLQNWSKCVWIFRGKYADKLEIEEKLSQTHFLFHLHQNPRDIFPGKRRNNIRCDEKHVHLCSIPFIALPKSVLLFWKNTWSSTSSSTCHLDHTHKRPFQMLLVQTELCVLWAKSWQLLLIRSDNFFLFHGVAFDFNAKCYKVSVNTRRNKGVFSLLIKNTNGQLVWCTHFQLQKYW